MPNYQAIFKHTVGVRNMDTGMIAEKECDAGWWVGTPSWAQMYVLQGLQRELEKAEAAEAKKNEAEEEEGKDDEPVAEGS